MKMPMAITAENLADLHGISREECDQYAMQSQQRWGAAQQAGRLELGRSLVKILSQDWICFPV